MTILRQIAALLLSVLVASSEMAADELRLAGGDRLTGTVKRLARGTLIFDTPHGELRVPWASVSHLKLDREMLVTLEDAEPRLMVIDSSAADGPELAEIAGIQAPPAALTIDGGGNAGFITTGGNTDITNLRLDGDLIARRPSDRFTVDAVMNRGKEAGRETAQNTTGSLKYDRFLSERLFVNGSAILTNDEFRGLDLRTALGAGIGYQVWDTAAARLAVDGGIGYVRENFASDPDDGYTAAREALTLDLFFAGERLQAFHHHDGYFGLTGDDNLFYRMQNGLRVGLVGGLVSTAQIDMDYDRSPAPGRVNTDRSFSLTFGYRF
jgi:putative salt-induced outer membrane protein YdiY